MQNTYIVMYLNLLLKTEAVQIVKKNPPVVYSNNLREYTCTRQITLHTFIHFTGIIN